MSLRHLARILFLSCTTFSSTLAWAQSYNTLDIGTLGGSVTEAYGLNSSGQVVGDSYTAAGSSVDHAYLTGADGSNMTDLGTLPSALPHLSIGESVNDQGQVTGISYNSSHKPRAFITGINGMGMTDLGSLGGNNSLGNAINGSGQVAGSSQLSGNAVTHAFLTGANGAGMSDLGTLGGGFSEAEGLNDSGQAVGDSTTASGDSHAFITGANGVGMTDLGTLGGTTSTAYAINHAGMVVGDAFLANGDDHAFLTGANGTGMTDLGTLGGTVSLARALNSSGMVVGYSVLADGATDHAFVTGANGTGMVDLNTLVSLSGVSLTDAYGINDAGQILAWGSDSHAYLLTPVPEATPGLAMAEGLGLLAALAWSHRARNRRSAGWIEPSGLNGSG